MNSKIRYDVFLTSDYCNWEYGKLIADRNGIESLEYAMTLAKYMKEEHPNADHVYITVHKTFEVTELIQNVTDKPWDDMVKPEEWRVVWKNSCGGDFTATSFDKAVSDAKDTLINWMAEVKSAWKGEKPTKEEAENWNAMIRNNGFWIEGYNPSKEKYELMYEPSEEELKRIGWMLWEEK